MPLASEVTLGKHQLTNPIPKSNLHVLTKKRKECPRCVHIGDPTCFCVGAFTWPSHDTHQTSAPNSLKASSYGKSKSLVL
jgi:hypothetical protein